MSELDDIRARRAAAERADGRMDAGCRYCGGIHQQQHLYLCVQHEPCS